MSTRTVQRRLEHAETIEGGLCPEVGRAVVGRPLSNKLGVLARVAKIPKPEIQADVVNLYDRNQRVGAYALDSWERELVPEDDDPEEEPEEPELIYSALVGQNAELFRDVLRLHVPRGSVVADVTWGRGSFWRQIPKKAYDVRASDILGGVDARHLPYDDQSVDAVVIDPPYQNWGSTGMTAMAEDLRDRYQNHERREHRGHEGVVRIYVEMAVEAVRILKPSGCLVVKCQDEVESGRQRLTHVEIVEAYRELGLACDDLFVLVQSGRMPTKKINVQQHARKNHSYFLVFRPEVTTNGAGWA